MEVLLKPEDVKFKKNFRLAVAGASEAGKTSLVLFILENIASLVDGDSFDHIIWSVGDWSSAPRQLTSLLPEVKIEKGLDFLDSIKPNTLIIFDDLISKIYDDPRVVDLTVRRSSKERVSYILITQNLFHQARHARTINLSINYLILFPCQRDMQTYEIVCRQICGGRNFKGIFNALISHLAEEPYKFAIIDLHPRTHPALKFRTFDRIGDKIVHQLFLSPQDKYYLEKQGLKEEVEEEEKDE